MTWGVSFSSSLGLSEGTFIPESGGRGCTVVRSAHGQMKQLLSLVGHCVLESALFPAAFTLLLLCTHPSEVAPNTKGRGKKKKKQPVNNNINCHQWSEQCYKSLLDHRMSMLRKFPFSLKLCVIGRDRGPVCSCPSCIEKLGQVCPFSPQHSISRQHNQTFQKY